MSLVNVVVFLCCLLFCLCVCLFPALYPCRSIPAGLVLGFFPSVPLGGRRAGVRSTFPPQRLGCSVFQMRSTCSRSSSMVCRCVFLFFPCPGFHSHDFLSFSPVNSFWLFPLFLLFFFCIMSCGFPLLVFSSVFPSSFVLLLLHHVLWFPSSFVRPRFGSRNRLRNHQT